jgi:hypothetical protein
MQSLLKVATQPLVTFFIAPPNQPTHFRLFNAWPDPPVNIDHVVSPEEPVTGGITETLAKLRFVIDLKGRLKGDSGRLSWLLLRLNLNYYRDRKS